MAFVDFFSFKFLCIYTLITELFLFKARYISFMKINVSNIIDRGQKFGGTQKTSCSEERASQGMITIQDCNIFAIFIWMAKYVGCITNQ
jgi:hypothetical protein